MLQEVKDTVERIENAIIGDPKYGSIGLTGRVNRLESKAARIKWSIGGLITLGGTIAGLLKLGIL
jgi:hypothetical protein